MAKAVWNGILIAESEHYEIVERDVCFLPDFVNREYFSESDHHTALPGRTRLAT